MKMRQKGRRMKGDTIKVMIRTKKDCRFSKIGAGVAREINETSRGIKLLPSSVTLLQEKSRWEQEPLYLSKRTGNFSKNFLQRTKRLLPIPSRSSPH